MIAAVMQIIGADGVDMCVFSSSFSYWHVLWPSSTLIPEFPLTQQERETSVCGVAQKPRRPFVLYQPRVPEAGPDPHRACRSDGPQAGLVPTHYNRTLARYSRPGRSLYKTHCQPRLWH